MVAKFVVEIEANEEESRPERHVQVCVYDNLAALRSAATRHDRRSMSNRQRTRHKNPHAETMGICHRFEHEGPNGEYRPLCAIIRLAVPYIGAGITAHECAHATQWIWELDYGHLPFTAEHDEPFAWILGELCRQITIKMHDIGAHDKADEVTDE